MKAGKLIYTEDVAAPGTVLVTRQSKLTGKHNSMVVPLPREAFEDGLAAWATGALIQDAFPTRNANQREFVLTGTTPEEWDAAFGEDEA